MSSGKGIKLLAVLPKAGVPGVSRRCFSSKLQPEDLRQYLQGWMGSTAASRPPGQSGVARNSVPGVGLSTAKVQTQEEDHTETAGNEGVAVTIAGRSYLVPTLRVPLNASPQDLSQGVKSTSSLTRGYFKSAPIVLDLVEWAGNTSLDEKTLATMLHELKSSGLHPVGVTNANTAELQAAAVAAGVPCFLGRHVTAPATHSSPPKEKPHVVKPEIQSRGINAAAEDAPAASRLPTKVVHGNVRTGQQVIAEKSSLVVMGSVNSGAEVAADGDIHIYGTLRGRALSGLSGDVKAQIFAAKFNAELCAVADVFTTCDQPANLSGLKPNSPTTVWLDPASRKLRFRSL